MTEVYKNAITLDKDYYCSLKQRLSYMIKSSTYQDMVIVTYRQHTICCVPKINTSIPLVALVMYNRQ